VDRLVGRGLVARSPSSSDKRAQELRTTAEGQVLAARATALLREGEKAVMVALTAGERAILAELLHKVARAGHR
jgi:DNA-binding MarR family transcriptional regulator